MTKLINNLNSDDRLAEREWMVETQLKERDITDKAVLEAMLTVPRHEFVSEAQQEYAYSDSPIKIEVGQTVSQPYIVALMAQALKLNENDKVLEVGTGSGYSAAVLSQISQHVYSIERHEVLAYLAQERFKGLGYVNIEVHIGDGTLGWPEKAPFEAILVTAGGPAIPDSLIDQLDINGRLVIPVGNKGEQKLLRITKTVTKELVEEDLGLVRFVPLIGTEGWDGQNQINAQ